MKNDSLEKLLEEFYESSGTLSNIARNLAFAGVGIIWILSKETVNNLYSYHWPLIILSLSLLLDLFQYLWKTITIYFFYKKKELKYKANEISPTEEILYPCYIERGTWIFFSIKIVLVIVAFILIFINLFSLMF